MRLIAAASVFALLAGNTVAQGVVDANSGLVRARDIIGGDVYTLNPAEDEMSWGADIPFAGEDKSWNEIGEIEDVILDRSGNLVGIVAEVGGFLDIGDKHVLLPVEDIRLVPSDDDDEYAYVTRYSEEDLEALPDVDEGWWK